MTMQWSGWLLLSASLPQTAGPLQVSSDRCVLYYVVTVSTDPVVLIPADVLLVLQYLICQCSVHADLAVNPDYERCFEGRFALEADTVCTEGTKVTAVCRNISAGTNVRLQATFFVDEAMFLRQAGTYSMLPRGLLVSGETCLPNF